MFMLIHQLILITRDQPIWILLIAFLGFFTTLKKSISLLKWVYVYFIRPSKNLKTRYGSWALVTGATDGIGKAFCHELAKKGLNLILVGRNPEKLKNVWGEMRSNFPDTKVKSVIFDFSDNDMSKGIKKIEEAIEGVDVGVLINNVGVTYPGARYFHEVEEKVWMNVLRVNLEGTTRVTRAVLPIMIGRKKGAIVNIGSGASVVVPSHPLYTIYSATKAYVDQLSRCLYMEYKSSGIDVQCQVPLYVATKMVKEITSNSKTTLFTPSADDYARAAVKRIGYEARCTPHWSHSVQWFLASLLPDSVLDATRLDVATRRREWELKSK